MFSAPTMVPYPFRAHIRPRADGRFTFARDGEMACLVNVPDDLGYFGDCVAWLPGEPGEWWMHEGRLPILGMLEVFFAADMGCDLLLVETPARFVEFGRGGRWPGPCAAILDWEARDSLRLWLSAVRGVRCETDSLARAVEGLLAAVPQRQRLRVETVAATKLSCKAECERVDLDRGTKLEPFPLRERVAVRVDAKRVEAAA